MIKTILEKVRQYAKEGIFHIFFAIGLGVGEHWFAFADERPILAFVEVREKGVRFERFLEFCDICGVAIAQKLFIHACAADHYDVVRIVVLQYFAELMERARHHCAIGIIILAPTQDDIRSVFQWLSVRERCERC